MIRLACLNDAGGWGRALMQQARLRRWSVREFGAGHNHKFSTPHHVFMRINQGEPRMSVERRIAISLHAAGHKFIIGLQDILEYEDKFTQALRYKDWMPPTFVVDNDAAARDALGKLTYPFVSKSRTGSASCNVRLVSNKGEAEAEIRGAFSKGITVPHRLGEKVQRGYLIWQEFLPGNAYDYRVCRIGRWMMILRRGNRDTLPFASGSGRTEPVTELNTETKQVYEFSEEFFASVGTKWCGIDVVRDPSGKWRLLETTIGWKQSAYTDCVFFGTDKTGGEMWNLVCDELEAGVFE